MGKKLQFKIFWPGSVLHECFTITDKGHAVQQTSLPESFRLKLFSWQVVVNLNRTAVAVAVGKEHVCALLVRTLNPEP